jgi:hypothetical protein
VQAPRSAWLVLLVLVLVASPYAAQPSCTDWQECREQALAARERDDGEAFHDLAWRAVQTGPRNDPALLFLVARAQSVSGRPHDALVMLQRLLSRGIDLTDTETSDDFRRVRSLPGWTDLVERVRATAAASSSAEPERKADATTGGESAARPRRNPKTAASPRRLDSPSTSTSAASLLPTTPAASGGPKTAAANSSLPLPEALRAPRALAYDRVSGRVLLADDDTETLKVLSELSGTAVDLVSRGWGGPYRTTAIAIDPARGDLWVAATAQDPESAPAPAVVHRVQLVSGRLLESVPVDANHGAVALSSLAVTGNHVLVLDTAGSRLYELSAGRKTLRRRATFAVADTTSLAVADSDTAYVAHAGGVLRVALASGRATAVRAAADIAVDRIRWMGWHGRSLWGVQEQRDGGHVAVRWRLDSRGRRITARDVLGPAASPAAAIMRDEFFYVGVQPDGTAAIHRLALR